MTRQTDSVIKFLFNDYPVRGVWVSLDNSLQTIMQQHAYTAPIDSFLAQMLSVSCLLMSTVKQVDNLTIQLESQSVIDMLVAKINDQFEIRGLGRLKEAAMADELSQAFQAGKLVVSCKPASSQQIFQSIVPIQARSIAEAIQDYFMQSEQIKTKIWLCSDGQHASGLLLQALPQQILDDDAWQHITVLADTLTDSELSTLSVEELLKRLYHEETIQLYDVQPVEFACPCSFEKMQNAVYLHGKEQAQAILDEHAMIEVTCEFCNQNFQFGQDEIDSIFNIQ